MSGVGVVAVGNDAMSIMIDIYLAGVCSGAGGALSLTITEPGFHVDTLDDAARYGHEMAMTLQEDPLMLEGLREKILRILRAHADGQAVGHG